MTMKNLNAKELMRGDTVLYVAPDSSIIAGQIHEFYDRQNQIRIGGYPLRVPAADTVLARDAFDALVLPIIEQQAKDRKAAAEAQALADKAAAQATATAPEPPKALEPSNTPSTPSTPPAGNV